MPCYQYKVILKLITIGPIPYIWYIAIKIKFRVTNDDCPEMIVINLFGKTPYRIVYFGKRYFRNIKSIITR